MGCAEHSPVWDDEQGSADPCCVACVRCRGRAGAAAGAAKPYSSRLDAEVSAMQRNSSTYCDEPEDREDYEVTPPSSFTQQCPGNHAPVHGCYGVQCSSLDRVAVEVPGDATGVHIPQHPLSGLPCETPGFWYKGAHVCSVAAQARLAGLNLCTKQGCRAGIPGSKKRMHMSH